MNLRPGMRVPTEVSTTAAMDQGAGGAVCMTAAHDLLPCHGCICKVASVLCASTWRGSLCNSGPVTPEWSANMDRCTQQKLVKEATACGYIGIEGACTCTQVCAWSAYAYIKHTIVLTSQTGQEQLIHSLQIDLPLCYKRVLIV